MRIVRFEYKQEILYGVLRGDEISIIAGQPFGEIQTSGRTIGLSEVTLLAPVAPPNLIALGLNYGRHATETAMALPDHPLLFLKATTSVIGPEAAIVLPRMAPDEVDYEAELCIVIGKTAKNVCEAEALDYVLGYTCGNDVSARDCQLRHDSQWARGKSFDTFAPLGPWIETAMDPDNAGIYSRLNGQIMQQSNTSDMIFNCSQLVSFLSHCMTLLPGTVVMTGTPEGVGFTREPPVFLRPGDVAEIEIAGIGTLTNHVEADS